MELLSVSNARSTWLLDMNDLTPRGQFVFPRLLEWLKSHYKFAVAPSSPADVDKEVKGWVFKQGLFQTTNGIVPVELTVYTDGVAGNTYSSTRDTDAFLEDAFNRATKDVGISYKPSLVRKKMPLSELVVRLEKKLPNVNPMLSPISSEITKRSPEPSAFELGGLSFWTDRSEASLKLSPFMIERKADAPFSENRFYSKASLHTDDHLEIIGKLEGMLQ